MTKRYKSDMMAVAHRAATELSDASLLRKRTMREFDEVCLAPVTGLEPAEIRALRLREKASSGCDASATRPAPPSPRAPKPG